MSAINKILKIAFLILDNNTDFKMTMRATDKTEQEVEGVYRPIENNLKTLKKIFLSKFASTPVKISKGSLVINFQMMERNMQAYIKECLGNGHVSSLINMIFNEISVDDVVPSGEILLHVKIELNKNLDLPVPSKYHIPTMSTYIMLVVFFFSQKIKRTVKRNKYKLTLRITLCPFF